MEPGTVKEWRGDKYAYLGGDPKSKSSWEKMKPFVPSGQKKEKTGFDVAGEGLMAFDQMARAAQKTHPLMAAFNAAGESVSPENAYKAGGAVTDFTGSPELGFATNLGIGALPSILSGIPAKNVSESVLKPAGRKVMQMAMKPDKIARESGAGARAIETMLKEGKNVTSGGMADLSNEVRVLSGQVDEIINAAQASGTTVSKVSLVKAARDAIKDIGKSLGSQDDVVAAEKVLSRILADPKIKDLDAIPIRAAQDIKTATYRALGEKAYNVADKLGTAELNVTKGAIRGMKEGIERSAPGVIPKNQRMSELLNAIEVAEPRALAGGNANLGGLAYLAENPFAAGGFMLDRSEVAKSLLARGLYSGAPSILGRGTQLTTPMIWGKQAYE